ncbi:hypothetical protein LLH03_10350 [bacterium]|nr:hypothetical protein [bacterium]
MRKRGRGRIGTLTKGPRWALRGLVALCLLTLLTGCERMIPPKGKMPLPPSDLLVKVPPAAYGGLSQSFRRVADALPQISDYRRQAEGIVGGIIPAPTQLQETARSLASALSSLRAALAEEPERWPGTMGSWEYDAQAVAELADAVAVVACAELKAGDTAECLAVCTDAVRLAAFLCACPDPEAEKDAVRLERAAAAVLTTGITSHSFRRDELVKVDRLAAEALQKVPALDLILRQGLTTAVESYRAMSTEDWSQTVRTLWRFDPRRDPAGSMKTAWDKWQTLLRATALPAPQGLAMERALEPPRDPLEQVFSIPASKILECRYTRLQVLQRLRIVTALELSRLADDRYPAGLSALTPQYLARVPADPLTGRPFTYDRQGSGYTLTP